MSDSEEGKKRRTISDLIEDDIAHLVKWMSTPHAKNLLREMNAFEAQEELKSAPLSDEWRRRAKAAYTEAQQHTSEIHRRIWDCITHALATAPLNSIQYTLALNERSKILLHMGMARECERDIDRALAEIQGRSECRIFTCNLLLRKIQCWKECMHYIPRILKKRLLVNIYEIPPSKHSERMRIYNKLRDLNDFVQCIDSDEETEDEGQRIRLPQVRHHPRHKPGNSDALAVRFYISPPFGFCTMATRQLYAGEIISVEPVFAAISERKNDLMICGHCIALSWTPVPCFDCRMLFCTEKCRDTAIVKYHYYECVLMRYELGINAAGKNWFNDSSMLGLRMLIMARVECGSNEVLIRRIRGFNKDFAPIECARRSERFESYFILGSHIKANPSITYASITALIAVAKRCALFKDSFYEFDSIEDLINDRDALEIGALILRYVVIAQYYSQTIFEPYVKIWMDEKWQLHFAVESVLPRGRTMSSIVSYFNHSCYPNVASIFNDDSQIILYVLRPISEFEEMVICYNLPYYSRVP